MDRASGAGIHALAAQTAFFKVDVCKVVLYGYGIESTFLDAFRATYAGVGAGFAGDSSFFLVYAAYEYAAVFRSFVSQFYDMLGAGLDTCPASSAFFFVHFRQSRFGVYVYGIKGTSPFTIPSAEASERTAGFAYV